MAPKHRLTKIKSEEGVAGLKHEEPEQVAKRPKMSAASASRSATPTDHGAKVPFSVEYPDMSNTRSLSEQEQEQVLAAEIMESPFVARGAKKGELDQYYCVTPIQEWKDMKKYNNFIIQREIYKNNQFVFVRGEATPKVKDSQEQPKDFWVARILQVRAKNSQHVYALVAWMYWTEELPPVRPKPADQLTASNGKGKYHGGHELVASNYMDVLDVLSFAGKADVYHWEEEDDNLTHKLYWRQTFCRTTQALSKPRAHCVCNGHYNPEITMFICDNPSCRLWCHRKCLIDDVLKTTHTRLLGSSNGVAKRKGKHTSAPKGVFKALLQVKGDAPPEMKITDMRINADPKTWTEGVVCPKCSVRLT